MRRLYLQVYMTVAASLVVFGALVSVLWMVVSERADNRDLLDGVGAIALEILPGPEQPLPALQDALEGIQASLPVVLAVDDASGRRLALAGGDMPELPVGRTSSGRLLARGFGPVWSIALEDGRWLLVRPLRFRGPPLARLIVLLGLLAVAVALASYPLVRGTTRRLERLQQRVEDLGSGDLTARVRVEGRDEVAALAQSFNDAAARIETLVNAHKTLLANASHELRTPLTRLRMHLDLLGEDAIPARSAEAARDIAELDQLVGEILLASRLDAGAGRTQQEIVDLLALLAEECARSGAELAGEPTQLRGDPELLRRLFRNLLENARRHGGGEVEVGVGERDGRIEVRVCDRGPGISEDERERIFEAFYRPARTRESGDGGSGLGLAIARQIAEQHEGRVTCQPREGGGSCFVVSVPPNARGCRLAQCSSSRSDL
jgi:signal transduction histidine kinase